MDDQGREQPSKKLVAVLSINLDATEYEESENNFHRVFSFIENEI
jgi:hypothetical protein